MSTFDYARKNSNKANLSSSDGKPKSSGMNQGFRRAVYNMDETPATTRGDTEPDLETYHQGQHELSSETTEKAKKFVNQFDTSTEEFERMNTEELDKIGTEEFEQISTGELDQAKQENNTESLVTDSPKKSNESKTEPLESSELEISDNESATAREDYRATSLRTNSAHLQYSLSELSKRAFTPSNDAKDSVSDQSDKFYTQYDKDNEQFKEAKERFTNTHRFLEEIHDDLEEAKETNDAKEIKNLEIAFVKEYHNFRQSHDTINQIMSKEKIFLDDYRYKQHKDMEQQLVRQVEGFINGLSKKTQKRIENFKEERFEEREAVLKDVHKTINDLIEDWNSGNRSYSSGQLLEFTKFVRQQITEKGHGIDTDISATTNKTWHNRLNQQKQSYLSLDRYLKALEENLAAFFSKAVGKPPFSNSDGESWNEVDARA